jgi:uncharacterized protein YkwD
VQGSFLITFDRYGLALAGWPISDEVTENGLQVQYFERMKMEYHPELASRGNAVLLTRLGAIMAPQAQSAPIASFASTTTRRYFPQTGHSLSAPFLKYWQTHGSVEVLGYPVSEQMDENGLKVQWFERARLEYHPDLANTNWAIQLSLLGMQAFSNTGGNTSTINLAAPEKQLLESINAERNKAGVGPVAPLSNLTDLAQARSADMATRDYFSHTTPEGTGFLDMLRARSIQYNFAGEIIARNNAPASDQSTQMALQVFLDSPSHRQIMLDPQYTYMGVGYARSGSNMSYFTVIFLRR